MIFFNMFGKTLSLDDLHYSSRYSALMQLLIPGGVIADYQSSGAHAGWRWSCMQQADPRAENDVDEHCSCP